MTTQLMPAISTQLRDVIFANQDWFRDETRRFFGDVSYQTLKGNITGMIYLVRATYAWSGFYGLPRYLHYRVNSLNQASLRIDSLIGSPFKDMHEVRQWLEVN